MNPGATPQTQPVQPTPSAQETHSMPILMNRFLDVAASVLIVFLVSVTAGGAAFLGA